VGFLYPAPAKAGGYDGFCHFPPVSAQFYDFQPFRASASRATVVAKPAIEAAITNLATATAAGAVALPASASAIAAGASAFPAGADA